MVNKKRRTTQKKAETAESPKDFENRSKKKRGGNNGFEGVRNLVLLSRCEIIYRLCWVRLL